MSKLRSLWYTLTKSTAWNNGYYSFKRGQNKKDNPYPSYDCSNREWSAGWIKAFYE